VGRMTVGRGKGVGVAALLNGKGAPTNFNGAGGGPEAPRGKATVRLT
jgi:hypothetical protein